MTLTYFIYAYVFVPAVILLYPVLAVWCVYRIARKPWTRGARLAMATAVALAFVLIPAADVIVGRVYFGRLCAMEARLVAFRHAYLDSTEFRPDGYAERKRIPGQSAYKFADRYVMQFRDEEVLHWPRIEKTTVQIRDTEQGDVLGEHVNFRYWGGWLSNQMPGHLYAERCPQLGDRPSVESLVFQMRR